MAFTWTVTRQTVGVLALVVAVVFHPAYGAVAQEVQGAGSTFVAPVIGKWAEHYGKITGKKIDYQSVGSGAGIQMIEAGAVDFGATDKPLDSAELAKYGLCQFPVVIGAVVPVVNLPGISPGQMKFSGEVLADIFMGKVTQWDDRAIRSVNAGLKLPHLPIITVYRSDGSGTTYNWTDFLAKASPAWKSKFGVGLSVKWPVGISGNGNEGVAAVVQKTSGAIGYVEYSYAVGSKMAYGQVANAFGLFILPSPYTFEAAGSTVDWQRYQDFNVLMTAAGGPDAYPITATTFIVMPKTPKDASRSAAAVAFFKWALENGDSDAAELRYLALPPTVVVLVEKYWASHIRPKVSN